jgi:hypothetical protein
MIDGAGADILNLTWLGKTDTLRTMGFLLEPQVEGRSDFRVLGIVRVTNGFPKPVVEFVAIDNDFLRMDGFDGAERDGEITGILDVDDQLGLAVWRDLADSTEGFVCIRDEDFKALLNLFVGHCCLRCATKTAAFLCEALLEG